MLKYASRLLALGSALILSHAAFAAECRSHFRSALILNEGWKIQSSRELHEAPEQISSPTFLPIGWMDAVVPGTVIESVMKASFREDPFYSMNLRKLPGMTYPIGADFNLLPMDSSSPFARSWWYRTAFKAPVTAGCPDQQLQLQLGSISYSANIWFNGKKIAGTVDTAGTFRSHEFNVSSLIRPGQLNALAIEVFAPTPENLASTWVDWNPSPPDKNMGIWHEVKLSSTGPVQLRHSVINSDFEAIPGTQPQTADITLNIDLTNSTNHEVKGELQATIETAERRPQMVTQVVTLAAGETRTLRIDPKTHPEFKVQNPKLWWPKIMGAQPLYRMRTEFVIGEVVSDRSLTRFGIRKVTSELTAEGSRLFRINGQRILIRGAGWAPDMFLRNSLARQEQELKYVRDLGLNTIRMEGKFESEQFLDLCDKYGILVMPGWTCCSHWENHDKWKDEDFDIAKASLRDQLYHHANHPSVFVWLYGSDEAPTPEIEKIYLDTVQETHWSNPTLAAASGAKTTVGETGVKMLGPYDYIPPSYWLTDAKFGGAFSFNTETGPGPAVPPLESLKKMIPENHLWPIDQEWNFHAGSDRFQNLNRFIGGLNARYGAAKNVGEFAMKSQVMAYDGHRAMFEAYSRNKYQTATGVIQWMLNNAWPSLIWHLYDYYLRPAGSYFGAKKANEAVHVQYSYDDRSIAVVNQKYEAIQGLQVSAKVLNFDLSIKHLESKTVDIAADSVVRAFILPEITGLTKTYFVKLTLKDRLGKLVSDNLYWLSTQKEELDWGKTDFTGTPVLVDGDMQLLNSLPPAQVTVRSLRRSASTTVEVSNPSPNLAFSLRLKLTRGKGGEEVLPVLWDDNYFSLLPGETKTVRAHYEAKDLGRAKPAIEIEGWNLRQRFDEAALDDRSPPAPDEEAGTAEDFQAR